MTIYLVVFSVVNLLAIFYFYLMVKNYRQLNVLLKEHTLDKDESLLTFGFIDKVFQDFPDQPDMSRTQRKVVKSAVHAGLLLFVGRYLIKFV